MPRVKVAYRRSKLPSGVKDSVRALALSGEPVKAIARQYGVDPSTVRALAADLRGIDVDQVRTLQAALPALMTILAAEHANVSLALARDNPRLASNAMYSAKLAVEAGRLAEPHAERPGLTVLSFIHQLGVQVVAPEAQAPALVASEPAPPTWDTPAELASILEPPSPAGAEPDGVSESSAPPELAQLLLFARA